jgi:glutathione S-transferase
MSHDPYQLYYWPGLQGRGEFVRLTLEDAGAPYVDVARLPAAEGGGIPALRKLMKSGAAPLEPFAPPFLKSGELVIAQTANILLYLAPRHGLIPTDEASRLRGNQLQLAVADLVGEAHDTHHPLSTGLYYEDQKPAALTRATSFVRERLPKFLGYFERVLKANDGKHFVGDAVSYVDLSVFQVIEGLHYAFPRGMAGMASQIPRLLALRDAVAARPQLSAYLASPRRLPFNEDGIFRRYPELDVALAE